MDHLIQLASFVLLLLSSSGLLGLAGRLTRIETLLTNNDKTLVDHETRIRELEKNHVG